MTDDNGYVPVCSRCGAEHPQFTVAKAAEDADGSVRVVASTRYCSTCWDGVDKGDPIPADDDAGSSLDEQIIANQAIPDNWRMPPWMRPIAPLMVVPEGWTVEQVYHFRRDDHPHMTPQDAARIGLAAVAVEAQVMLLYRLYERGQKTLNPEPLILLTGRRPHA